MLALLGESASGKTTIALPLLGYARTGCSISGGSVRIGDLEVLSLDAKGRRALRARTVAYVAQSASAGFNPARTIMDQVTEPALLHHLTTNDIKSLQPGRCCEAALVTNKARCLDILTILRLEKDFLVITSPNRREMFAPHAKGFIVFRQDVKIEDVTGQIFSIGVFGAETHDVTSAYLSPEVLPEKNEIVRININDTPVDVLRTDRLPGGGFLCVTPSAETARQIQTDLKLPECGNETYNILRVEAGLPVAGLEITEAHNPWEANLDNMISLHKGCYNGQEIIARLNTYEKVKQHLKGLKLSGPVPSNAETALQGDGKNAGEITSIIYSPCGGYIALAYVKKNYEPAGTALKVLFNGEEVDAEVVELPF